jgi:SAM-dependent methyltransferase
MDRLLNRILPSFLARRECNLCGWRGWRFVPMGTQKYIREDAKCPRCSSLERHRALIKHFDGHDGIRGIRVLDIAPMRLFKEYFESRGARYYSIDLFRNAMIRGNLLAAPFCDGAFDLIICYHVMEHIKDDTGALRELARICMPDGKLYLQVPIDEGLSKTREYDAPDPYCHDHVRQYGTDFPERIAEAGLRILSADDFGDLPDPKTTERLGIRNYTGLTYICSPA